MAENWRKARERERYEREIERRERFCVQDLFPNVRTYLIREPYLIIIYYSVNPSDCKNVVFDLTNPQKMVQEINTWPCPLLFLGYFVIQYLKIDYCRVVPWFKKQISWKLSPWRLNKKILYTDGFESFYKSGSELGSNFWNMAYQQYQVLLLIYFKLRNHAKWIHFREVHEFEP